MKRDRSSTGDQAGAPASAVTLGEAVKNACIRAALEGYEQAAIAGLCHEGAWECAVDAMRMVDVGALLERDSSMPDAVPPPADQEKKAADA